VVVDGLVTTSRGVGTALHFALALVAQLRGVDAATSLGQAMLVPALR
jgi:transcriptional regulator GlxA family with amidase domain